jgi:hypothetical protein
MVEMYKNNISIIQSYISISIFLCLVSGINCYSNDNPDNYVYFELKRKDDIKIKTLNNITEIMRFIYLEPLISELNIGEPSQNVDIIFRTDCFYIYLTSENHKFKKNDKTIDLIKLKYGKLTYFNENKSQTLKNLDIFFNHSIYPYDNQFFTKSISDNININNKKINLDIMVSNDIEFDEPGAICLQLREDPKFVQLTASFPILLKEKKLINNHKWFIHYGIKKDYLVLGTSVNKFKDPESGNLLYPNFDELKNYSLDNDVVEVSKVGMTITLNDIYLIGNNKDDVVNFEDKNNLKGKLIPNIGVIVGTANYSTYVEKELLGKYLSNSQCYKEKFNQRPNLVGQEYTYYYCKESLYENIKTNFKTIVFKSIKFSTNFELNFDDLFIKQNGYLIFLVIFSTHQHFFWDLGIPFLKKYQFDYDFENKLIGFYQIEKEKAQSEETQNISDDDNKNWKYIILIFGFVLLGGLLIFLGIYLGKTYFQKKKKRANELDDDFEYKNKTKEEDIKNPILDEE